jgi:hypothetical protein
VPGSSSRPPRGAYGVELRHTDNAGIVLTVSLGDWLTIVTPPDHIAPLLRGPAT